MLYANTLTHEYTQDDAIVIYENMYTQDGVAGIPGLLKYDTFRGFFKTEGKAKLVSGGRYRPLTPIMFAVEYQLFGGNPFIGHLVNILLYGLLGWLVYLVILRLLSPSMDTHIASWIAVAAGLIYIAHPIHTEAVANIKGRDEIMAMLGSMAAIWFSLRYLESQKVKDLLWVFVTFFLAFMSKENTITFLAVWPLAVYCFRRSQISTAVKPLLSMLGATVLFLAIRTSVLGFDLGGTPMELMNNPFLKLEGNNYVSLDLGEKLATIVYTLGKYIALLIYPHPLTHDYYPRHIDIMSWGDLKVIFSLLAYLGLIVFGILNLKKRPVLAFGVLFYIITLSIVSNIVFPIGTNMSERFMFMPSLGFAVVFGYVLMQNKWLPEKVNLSILVLIITLYSVKTVTRNMVWKDDFTLFTTDVHTSTKSAKILNAAGGALTTEAFKLEDGPKKTQMLQEAKGYLTRALRIHPGYKNAALILGNANYYLGTYEEAIKAYESGLIMAPGDKDIEDNLAVTLRVAGQAAGQQQGDIQKAQRYLNRSLQLRPDDIETIRLLGVSYGMQGNHQKAIEFFQKVVDENRTADSLNNLARAYGASGDETRAQQLFDEAKTLAK